MHVEFFQAFHSEQDRRHELAAFWQSLCQCANNRTWSTLLEIISREKRIHLERKVADYASELHGCFCCGSRVAPLPRKRTMTQTTASRTSVMSGMNMRQLPALYELCYQHTITPWRRLAAGRVLTPIRLNRRSYERKTYNQNTML